MRCKSCSNNNRHGERRSHATA